MREWNAGDTEPAILALAVIALLCIATVLISIYYPSPAHHPF